MATNTKIKIRLQGHEKFALRDGWLGVVRSFPNGESHSAPVARLPGLCPGPPLFICGKKNISFHKPRHFFIISKWGK